MALNPECESQIISSVEGNTATIERVCFSCDVVLQRFNIATSKGGVIAEQIANAQLEQANGLWNCPKKRRILTTSKPHPQRK